MIEFLNEIKDRMEDSEEEKNRAARKQPEVIEFSRMINILVIHAQSEHVTLQVKVPHVILDQVQYQDQVPKQTMRYDSKMG